MAVKFARVNAHVVISHGHTEGDEYERKKFRSGLGEALDMN